jgi:D-glycero-alpha-D-manno-heptose-7-phosphate kinase
MDFVKAPLRISYVGGGTDYPEFYRHNNGGVIAAAINQYVYLYAHPLSEVADENIRFTYRETESVLGLEDLKHPVLREMLRESKWNSRTNFGTFSDLPSGVGLGGSSSFAVALATIISSRVSGSPDPHDLAKLAIRIEREILQESGGVQDQYVASFGSIREYRFDSEGVRVSEPLLNSQDIDYLNDRQILLWLDESRDSANYARHTVQAIRSSNGSLQETAKLFETTSQAIQTSTKSSQKFAALKSAVELGWELKKHYITALTSQLLELERYFKDSGDVAFKLCGAGGTGFLLILGEPDVLKRIRVQLSESKILAPKIELHGSRFITFLP